MTDKKRSNAIEEPRKGKRPKNHPGRSKSKTSAREIDRSRAGKVAEQWDRLLGLRRELLAKREQADVWRTTPPTSAAAAVFTATIEELDQRIDAIDHAILITKSPTQALRGLIPVSIGVEVATLVGVYTWLLARTKENRIDVIEECPRVLVVAAAFALGRLRGGALATGADVSDSVIAEQLPYLEAALGTARESAAFNRDGPRAGAIVATAAALTSATGIAISGRRIERVIDAQITPPMDRDAWDREIRNHDDPRNCP